MGELIRWLGTSPSVWRLDQAVTVGGQAAKVLGGPRVVEGMRGSAVAFDGTRDGLIVPANPLAGWGAFTIEVLFQPAAGEQRSSAFCTWRMRRGRVR